MPPAWCGHACPSDKRWEGGHGTINNGCPLWVWPTHVIGQLPAPSLTVERSGQMQAGMWGARPCGPHHCPRQASQEHETKKKQKPLWVPCGRAARVGVGGGSSVHMHTRTHGQSRGLQEKHGQLGTVSPSHLRRSLLRCCHVGSMSVKGHPSFCEAPHLHPPPTHTAVSFASPGQARRGSPAAHQGYQTPKSAVLVLQASPD